MASRATGERQSQKRALAANRGSQKMAAPVLLENPCVLRGEMNYNELSLKFQMIVTIVFHDDTIYFRGWSILFPVHYPLAA